MLFFFVNKSFGDGLIRINSSVTQEWPMRSVDYLFLQYQFPPQLLLHYHAKLCIIILPNGLDNKRTAPEFHGTVLFKTNPVHTYYMHTIGNGMTSLNGLPCIVLFSIGFFIL